MQYRIPDNVSLRKSLNKYVVCFQGSEQYDDEMPIAVFNTVDECEQYICFLKEALGDEKIKFNVRFDRYVTNNTAALYGRNRKIYEGSTIGGWQILAYAGRTYGENKYWCRCMGCGQFFIKNIYAIRKGNSLHCKNCWIDGLRYDKWMSENSKAVRCTKDERMYAYKRYNGHCAFCGRKIEYRQMEVYISQKAFFLNTRNIDTLFPACRICNRAGKGKRIHIFKKEILKTNTTLHNSNAQYRLAERFDRIKWEDDGFLFYLEKEDVAEGEHNR